MNWKEFKELPPWNTIISIRVKNDDSTSMRVFYGSEDKLNTDETVKNITKCGHIGKKLEWLDET